MSCCRLPPTVGAIAAPRTISPGERSADDADRVSIPAAVTWVGTDRPVIRADGEGPARRVRLKAFAMDRHAVTNRRFAAFVAATGYATDAERFGWSFVFQLLPSGAPTTDSEGNPAWWRRTEGADWRHPAGPGSSADDLPDLPATHISWTDACAFAAWAGGRLPTEAEWEHAARGGKPHALYPWGDEEPSPDNPPCNIWRGVFPYTSDKAHPAGPDVVDSHIPNGYGLYNMSGNVWEWTADRFRVKSLSTAARRRDSAARLEDERVLKGGSFLCHKSYCYRYRIAARTGRSPDTSAAHTGFRLAYDAA